MPILLYGLDACALTNRNIQSLDFTVNRVLMKLLKTSNIEIIISECRFFWHWITKCAISKTFWEIFLHCEPVSWLDRVNQLRVLTFCTYFVFSLSPSVDVWCLFCVLNICYQQSCIKMNINSKYQCRRLIFICQIRPPTLHLHTKFDHNRVMLCWDIVTPTIFKVATVRHYWIFVCVWWTTREDRLVVYLFVVKGHRPLTNHSITKIYKQ